MAKWGGNKITLVPYSTSTLRIFLAVPSADSGSGGGDISMLGIKNELEEDDYSAGESFTNISLEELSDESEYTINTANSVDDRPDGSAPHAISEFASYDHDMTGAGTPGSLSYSSTTQAITFTYTEGANTERTYVYLRNLNGSTTFQNQIITDTGDNFAGSFPSGYQVVDGSGQSSFTLGDGDDTYAGVKGSPTQISTDLNQNDYLTIRIRGYDEGSSQYSSYTSDFTGWTLPDSPTSFAVSHARTGAVTAWGDGNDGAYTETLTWSAPTGNASSYKVTHGPNNNRENGANTQDVAVSSGTSLAITGINNTGTRYAWVAAVGGGGDTGAYTALGAHTVQETYFYNYFNSPTLSGAESTTAPLANTVEVFSDQLQVGVVFGPGNIVCNLQGASSNGSLFVAMGTGDPTDGDQGSSGFDSSATSNNGTGWVEEGSACTLSTGWDASASDIAYIRFKYETSLAAGTHNRTAHFTDSSDGAKLSTTIICVTTGKSDRRLKTNIDLVGHSKHLQIPIYTFNYNTDLNTTYKGVMAQDLLEMNFNHAVITDPDGYYSVLYDLIDVDMEKLN